MRTNCAWMKWKKELWGNIRLPPLVNEYRGFAGMAAWESRENIEQFDPWFLGDEGSRRHSVNPPKGAQHGCLVLLALARDLKSSFAQNGEKNLLPRSIIFMLNRVAAVPKKLVMLYPNQHQRPANNPGACVGIALLQTTGSAATIQQTLQSFSAAMSSQNPQRIAK